MSKGIKKHGEAPKHGATTEVASDLELAKKVGVKIAEEQLAEAGKTYAIPEARSGTMTLDELPNARKAFRSNIRTVRKLTPEETDDDAITRVYGAKQLAEDIKASPPGVMGDIWVGEWAGKTPPAWLSDLASEGKISYEVFKLDDGSHVVRAVIDGNRRLVAIGDLHKLFPKGTTVKLRTTDAQGVTVEKEFRKDFFTVPVKVFPGLEHDQYRQLQFASANRDEFRRGDVAKGAMEYIQNDPVRRGLEDDVKAHLGASNVRALTKADTFHSMYQELRRAALMTRDIFEQYVDYRNGEPGVAHPNNKDLRDMFQKFKEEFINYDGGEVTKGRYYDISFSPRRQTTDELLRLWQSWPAEKCKAAGLPEGKNPADVSEFLPMWFGIRTAKRQERKGGTAADQKTLKQYAGSLESQGAPSASGFVASLYGKPGADQKRRLDFQLKFEVLAWAALDKHEPEMAKKLREELSTIDRAETMAAKEMLAQGESPAPAAPAAPAAPPTPVEPPKQGGKKKK